MATKKGVTLGNLPREISKTLDTYNAEVQKEVATIARKVTRDTVAELKATSPKLTGEYAGNWTSTRDAYGFVVHQKPKTARLAHLLEKGWAKEGGGRVAPRVHIAPAEKKGIKEFEAKVRRALER